MSDAIKIGYRLSSLHDIRAHRRNLTQAGWAVYANGPPGMVTVAENLSETMALRMASCLDAFAGLEDDRIPRPEEMRNMLKALDHAKKADEHLSRIPYRPELSEIP